MANWEVCYNWMMDNEDAARQYRTVPDAPPGAFAISGINSASYPQQFNQINLIPLANRGPAVENFYHTTFWNPWFDKFTSDEVSKRVFDADVNMGQGAGIKILQQATNACYPDHPTDPIKVDGQLGPNTLSYVNGANPTELVQQFIKFRVQHYEDIITLKPDDAKYRTVWEARAKK